MTDLGLILITGNYGRFQIKNYNHLQEQLYARVTQNRVTLKTFFNVKFH